MVDVFISYSRENQDRVSLIAERVAALGYDIWWDEELPPHKSYGDVITEKISMAKAAIVVWSRSAVASEWVRAEADVARNQKKLIQTALDEVMPPMPFNQIQFADLQDWNGEDDHRGWRKVKASLEELCGPSAATTPRATAYPMPHDPPPREAVEAAFDRRRRTVPILVGLALTLTAAIAVIAFAWLRSGNGEEPPPVVEQEQEQTTVDEFPLVAVIDDPDGFTYIRLAPSGSAPVVGRVLDGDIFHTRAQNGDWWEIRTGDGVEGFMHRSRIRLIEAGGER